MLSAILHEFGRAASLVLHVGAATALARFLCSLYGRCDVPTLFSRLKAGAYQGKVVWITGASSGLGAEFARQLGSHGAKVILSARTTSALEEVRTSIIDAGAMPSDVIVMPLDTSVLSELPAAVERACAIFGGIDVFINNAGFSQREMGVNTEFPVVQNMTDVNYLAGVSMASALLPQMEARKGGHIVNISSIAGKMGVPLRTAYCGSKAAVLGYFDALRAEEFARGSGVLVTNVCPGSVRTNVARNAALAKKGNVRGDTDANIEAGLDPHWTCARILAAVACGVEEVWIAKPYELLLTHLAQYAPATFITMAKKSAAARMKQTLAAVEHGQK